MSLLISSTLLSCDPLSPSAMHFLTSPHGLATTPTSRPALLFLKSICIPRSGFSFHPFLDCRLTRCFIRNGLMGAIVLAFVALFSVASFFAKDRSTGAFAAQSFCLCLCLSRPPVVVRFFRTRTFLCLPFSPSLSNGTVDTQSRHKAPHQNGFLGHTPHSGMGRRDIFFVLLGFLIRKIGSVVV